MSIEENKAIARRHFEEVLEQGHVELIEGYYVPDGTDPKMDTPQQWRDRVLWHHKAAPGFKITILDMIAEGDKVVTHWQADVTYRDLSEPPFWGLGPMPSLGKPVSWRIMTILCIVNGKLVTTESVNGGTDMLVKEGVYVLAKPESA